VLAQLGRWCSDHRRVTAMWAVLFAACMLADWHESVDGSTYIWIQIRRSE